MAVLAGHGFDDVVDQLDLEERVVIKSMIKKRVGDKQTRWQRVADAMQELGPTFVKLGQILSTRSDMLPQEAIVELKKLQAHVKAESFESIKAVIETSLDDEVENVFASLDPEPLAAASMAQVH